MLYHKINNNLQKHRKLEALNTKYSSTWFYEKCIYSPQIHVHTHYTDVIMTKGASQITSLTIDQRKHQSSALLAFVWGIHRRPVTSPRKGRYAENASIWWRHHDRYAGMQVAVRTVCLLCISSTCLCLFLYYTRTNWFVSLFSLFTFTWLVG